MDPMQDSEDSFVLHGKIRGYQELYGSRKKDMAKGAQTTPVFNVADRS